MVWKHYSDEAYAPENEAVHYEDEHFHEDTEPPPQRLTFDEWCCWYSNDLLNMWMSLVQYRQDSGLTHYVMKEANYNDFCNFAYQTSHGYANCYPS
jgi:hypothetical protein